MVYVPVGPWLTTALIEWNALHTSWLQGCGRHYVSHNAPFMIRVKDLAIAILLTSAEPAEDDLPLYKYCSNPVLLGCLEGEELLIEHFGR